MIEHRPKKLLKAAGIIVCCNKALSTPTISIYSDFTLYIAAHPAFNTLEFGIFERCEKSLTALVSSVFIMLIRKKEAKSKKNAYASLFSITHEHDTKRTRTSEPRR